MAVGIRSNCDTLWKLWYASSVIFFSGYLLFRAISQYIEYKAQVFNPRFGGEWSLAPLNFYLSLIIAGAFFTALFVYSSLLKVGHVANDGTLIGKDTDNLKLSLLETTVNKSLLSVFYARIRRHVLPYCSLLHLLSSTMFLLPLAPLRAEQISNEAVNPERLVRTDLNFLIPTKAILQTNTQPAVSYPTHIPAVCPEFFNFAFATLVLAIQFPSSFWYTNRPFAVIFSLFIFITCMDILVEYEGLLFYFKLAHNSGNSILGMKLKYNLSSWFVLTVLFICILMSTMNLILTYEYGNGHFLQNLRRYRQYFMTEISDSVSEQSGGTRTKRSRIYQFWPCILSCVLFIPSFLMHIPVYIEYCRLFSQIGEPILLVGVISSSVFYTFWLLIWLGFSAKTKWRFRVCLGGTVHSGSSRSDSQVGSSKPNCANGNNNLGIMTGFESVYGCLHENNNLAPSNASHASSDRTPRTALRNAPEPLAPVDYAPSDGSRSTNSRNGFANYVYMQSPHGMVPTISENGPDEACVDSYTDTANVMQASSNQALLKSPTLLKPTYQNYANGPREPNYATLAPMNTSRPSPFAVAEPGLSHSLTRNCNNRRSNSRVTFKEPFHGALEGSVGINGISQNGFDNDFNYDARNNGSKCLGDQLSDTSDNPASEVELQQFKDGKFANKQHYIQDQALRYASDSDQLSQYNVTKAPCVTFQTNKGFDVGSKTNNISQYPSNSSGGSVIDPRLCSQV